MHTVDIGFGLGGRLDLRIFIVTVRLAVRPVGYRRFDDYHFLLLRLHRLPRVLLLLHDMREQTAKREGSNRTFGAAGFGLGGAVAAAAAGGGDCATAAAVVAAVAPLLLA